MTLLEQSQEAELAGGSKIGKDNIGSHERILLPEFDGWKTTIVSADLPTCLVPLKQSDGRVDGIAK